MDMTGIYYFFFLVKYWRQVLITIEGVLSLVEQGQTYVIMARKLEYRGLVMHAERLIMEWKRSIGRRKMRKWFACILLQLFRAAVWILKIDFMIDNFHKQIAFYVCLSMAFRDKSFSNHPILISPECLESRMTRKYVASFERASVYPFTYGGPTSGILYNSTVE